MNAPLDPAEVGQDQSRVVGWDTWPSVLHTSHIFDTQDDKELQCYFGRISGCFEALMESPWVAGA